ncbi:MAG: hypothetical protein EA365_01375 [Gloeocapsa sp. DLM2.Bin57]|nr:MAG: hypothetical protein EA365_01375 [Gloeocapsa sp. DLM2.Bin57]
MFLNRIHNEPIPVNPEMVFATIKTADAEGKDLGFHALKPGQRCTTTPRYHTWGVPKGFASRYA